MARQYRGKGSGGGRMMLLELRNTNSLESKLLYKKFKQTSLLHCLSATRDGLEISLITQSHYFSENKTRGTAYKIGEVKLK